MAGTSHFPRLNYHVRRGLCEIVAPTHRMTDKEWIEILDEFGQACAYCGEGASAANRGIVADHLIPVKEYGELVAGNTIPACQTCNDSRGKKDWRAFLTSRYPAAATERIARIEAHINRFGYAPATPETALTGDELAEYNAILDTWSAVLSRARRLRATVAERRAGETK